VRAFSISIRACSRSIARSTAWFIFVNGTEADAVLADAATGGAVFDGCGSGCPREEAGLNCAADSGVCAVAGDKDGFADCWAFALNVTGNEAIITQGHVRSNRAAAMLFIRNLLIF
jgi:hypothetical protein